ncbi:MAG: hypothetical protein ACJ763_01675 [Bdellovibrionia bacterium]
MIRSKISVLALLVLTMSSLAHASHSTESSKPSGEGGNIGIGAMFGDPTGVDLKYWLESTRALHFGLAYSFDHYGELMGNYLFEFPNAFKGKEGAQFVPYVGIGAAFFFGTDNDFHGHNDSAALGMRIPLGVEFLPHGAPIGITAEIAPGIGLIPSTFGFIQGYVGARLYF